MSEPFLIPWSARIDQQADDALGPEELLLEKEELELAGVDELPGRRAAPIPRTALHRGLERLSAPEREAIVGYFIGGQRQRDIAERAGISQPALQLRIQRAVQRLKWILGPGSWFSSEDIEQTFAGKMTDQEVQALSIYWRTTAHSTVHRALGLSSHASARRLVYGAIAKLEGRWRRGFDRLNSEAKLLLFQYGAESGPVGALADFLVRRCVFESGARVSGERLFATYEAHAINLGRPFDRARLRSELHRRGLRRLSVREGAAIAWGWAGVGLTSANATNRPRTGLSEAQGA